MTDADQTDSNCIEPWRDYVWEYSEERSQVWPTITEGIQAAEELRGELCGAFGGMISDDYDLVVFGSLARGEWTTGSDVDWTLLIDGQASSDHRFVAREIENALKQIKFREKTLAGPGAEGVFGNMAFSHDIVHHIGGQADTNKNTTQRILLLLEAASISETCNADNGPFERVVREILWRYLKDDTICLLPPGMESRIPRFLLNDIVRFWRTMCVDFAYKEWEQAGSKWALRNIKLRMSRKLLFVSGLLTVFSCFRNPNLVTHESPEGLISLMQDHLLQFVRSTPLNIVVWTLRELNLDNECAGLLDTYETFLNKLNDEGTRQWLGGLEPTNVYGDKVFQECHDISHAFQQQLNRIFYETDSPLREFIFEYGVF